MKMWELFEKPGTWTQKAYAKNAAGEVVGSGAPEATCWCIRGAHDKCYFHDPDQWVMIESVFETKLGNPIAWNDAKERTQADVLAFCKEHDI